MAPRGVRRGKDRSWRNGLIVIHETMTVNTTAADEDRFFFRTCVREGEPGFADDAFSDSGPYTTFAECYYRCIFFKPQER